MLGLFPYLRLESSYKDIHWCSWMASFLAVLVALVCSLAAVDHGNHRQVECVCFKTDPYGSRSFSAPPGLFVVFWNVFIHYVLITFFPLTQFLPAPSLLPNCMFLLSGEKEGEREKRKKAGRLKQQQHKIRWGNHWVYQPHSSAGPMPRRSWPTQNRCSVWYLALASYKEFLWEKVKWGP